MIQELTFRDLRPGQLLSVKSMFDIDSLCFLVAIDIKNEGSKTHHATIALTLLINDETTKILYFLNDKLSVCRVRVL